DRAALAHGPTLLGLARLALERLHGLVEGGGQVAGRRFAGEGAAAGAQRDAGTAPELLGHAHDASVDDLGQHPAQAVQLALDQRLERGSERDPAPAQDDLHRSRPLAGPDLAHRRRGASRRWCDGKMPSSSRYLATVRRAMTRARPLRICATSWSESG